MYSSWGEKLSVLAVQATQSALIQFPGHLAFLGPPQMEMSDITAEHLSASQGLLLPVLLTFIISWCF